MNSNILVRTEMTKIIKYENGGDIVPIDEFILIYKQPVEDGILVVYEKKSDRLVWDGNLRGRAGK